MIEISFCLYPRIQNSVQGFPNASGILGYFWDFYLLGIVIGIQIHSAYVFSLPHYFLNYENMYDTVASLKAPTDIGQFKDQY